MLSRNKIDNHNPNTHFSAFHIFLFCFIELMPIKWRIWASFFFHLGFISMFFEPFSNRTIRHLGYNSTLRTFLIFHTSFLGAMNTRVPSKNQKLCSRSLSIFELGRAKINRPPTWFQNRFHMFPYSSGQNFCMEMIKTNDSGLQSVSCGLFLTFHNTRSKEKNENKIPPIFGTRLSTFSYLTLPRRMAL